ncbi:MAG: FAD:protein FMN transferase [Gemmatimonadota bacterium]|nr:FAD:protein FMN transferase [Gemmatimonadota bacterium]
MTSVPESAFRASGSLAPRVAAGLVMGFVVLALFTLRGHFTDQNDAVQEWSGSTMGTTYNVKVDAEIDLTAQQGVANGIDSVLARVNALMSTYDSASEISRFNRHRSLEPFGISPELVQVLALAQEISDRSGGAFDVTVGPLVDAWGFGPEEPPPHPPGAPKLETLRERVGTQGLSLDSNLRTLTKGHREIGIDLSAIAKGYAVDLIAALLETRGLTRYLVEIGGELRAGAPKRLGVAWSVGIERPEPEQRRLGARLSLDRQAIATSGDYRNFRPTGEGPRAHLIDPRTGAAIPFTGVSVSVVDETAAAADAWATALSVAGAERGYELAVREGVAALFLSTAGAGVATRATPLFLERVTDFQEVERTW